MKFKVILLLCLLASCVTSQGTRGQRQSPMSMGMKVFEDLRGGVQRTFQGIMNRIVGRPESPPPPFKPGPQFQVVNPHHSKRQVQQQQQQQHQHHQPPAPFPHRFKSATSSSFAIIHEGPPTTLRPLLHERNSEKESFSHQSFGLRRPPPHDERLLSPHDKRQVPPHTNLFPESPHGKIRKSSLVGSPLIEKLPTTIDGWVAIPPPKGHLTIPEKRLSPALKKVDPESSKPEAQVVEAKPLPPPPPSSIAERDHPNQVRHDILASGIKQKHLKSHPSGSGGKVRRKRPFPPPKRLVKRNRKPQRHSGHNYNPANYPHPIFPEDIKRPLHNKNPVRNDIPSVHQPTGLNLARHTIQGAAQPFRQRPRQQKNGKLVSNGLRMKISEKDREAGVKDYEFGYGVVDKHSGNQFYHAEKKEGGTTKGSYKVQLPDGRVQTVDYMADDKGYHPKISFEGEAKFPDSSPKQFRSENSP